MVSSAIFDDSYTTNILSNAKVEPQVQFRVVVVIGTLPPFGFPLVDASVPI